MAVGDVLAGQLTQGGSVGQHNRTVGSDTLTIREVGEQNHLSKDGQAGNVLRETNNNEVKDPDEKQDEKVSYGFFFLSKIVRNLIVRLNMKKTF